MDGAVNWESEESALLLNPRLPSQEIEQCQSLYRQAPVLPAHLWLATSGSTRKLEDSPKLVALAKQAFLKSAEAVNTHLASTAKDCWLLSLPTFHVGGLAVLARAYLSGARVVPFVTDWSASSFHERVTQENVSLSPLVPTQVYDLVQAGLPSPPSLRAVVIGGGALSHALYEEARKLGWPLLPSFGMTECCSQIATARLESLRESHFPPLARLSHVELKLSSEGKLGVRSGSLLTLYGQSRSGENFFWDPKKDGFFWSEDRVLLKGAGLQPLGRDDDFVKISGENVSLSELSERLAGLDPHLAACSVLLTTSDLRRGARVILVSEAKPGPAVIDTFNKTVLPVARITDVYHVDRLPRSPLGKILRSALRAQIENQTK